MITYPNGLTVWGNGNPENNPWEKKLSSLLEKGGLVLDVGSGRYKVHPSCLGVDPYYDDPSVNVQAYMWDLPFGESSIDGIVCFHALEHVSKYQVIPTLTEFKRVIKPNGSILLLVPDLEWVIKAFLDNPGNGYSLDMIFGVQTHDNATINEGEFHRTGFTKDILAGYAEFVGLKPIQWYSVNGYNQYNIGVYLKKGR